MQKKVAIIGIDGADPSYIEKAVKLGRMPNFERLIENGSYGKLKSTIPPLSLPSWPSIYSGKNPGKTGVYNFVELKEGTYETEIVDWKVQNPIWKILSANGKKVAVVNNYFTYPPEAVNGVMITAIDNIEEGCYYPEEMEKEVEKDLGKLDFGLIPGYYAIPKKELTELTDRMLGSSVELVKYILKKEDPDFIITTLDIDRIHHLVSEEKDLIDWYSKIDSLVGKLIESMPDTNIILISDHGGGKMKKEFYVNEYLMQKGFLKLKNRYKNKSSSFLVKSGFSMENLLKFIQVTKLDLLLLKMLPSKVWDLAKEKVPRKDVPYPEAQIDWLNTTAYSPYHSAAAIQINLAGREPYGIVKKEDYAKKVEEVIAALKELEINGEKIKMEAYKKEEIYSGEYLYKAPDVSFIMDDWQYFPKISFSGSLFKEPRDPGHHRCYGFFLANGEDIKKSNVEGAIVYDILPTILKLFGISPPEDIDGKALDILK